MLPCLSLLPPTLVLNRLPAMPVLDGIDFYSSLDVKRLRQLELLVSDGTTLATAERLLPPLQPTNGNPSVKLEVTSLYGLRYVVCLIASVECFLTAILLDFRRTGTRES